MSDKAMTVSRAAIPAALADLFNVQSLAGDLTSNVSAGFAVLSIRAGKWRVKHGGEEEPILNEDGEPMPSIPVVLIKASPNVSKLYYAKAYEEGDVSEPDCYSEDGVAPAPDSPNKQASACATCPHNQWGSKITPAGKKAKACTDSRRVVVLPVAAKAEDADPEILYNEVRGGAMLLRVPATSLQDLATYGRKMTEKGFPYNTVATRIGFDLNVSYPKLTFKAIRVLNEEEILAVADVLRSGQVENILSAVSMPSAPTVAEPASAVDTEFEQEPEPAKPAKAESGKPARPAAATKAAKAESGKVTPIKPADVLESDLDDIMGELG